MSATTNVRPCGPEVPGLEAARTGIKEIMKDQIDVTVRRSPKYSAFIGVGAIVGILVSGVLILLVDPATIPDGYTVAKASGLLLLVMAICGGFLGAIVAIVLDRVGQKKSRNFTVGAEVTMVDDPKEIARQRIAEMKGEVPESEVPETQAPAEAGDESEDGTQPTSADDDGAPRRD